MTTQCVTDNAVVDGWNGAEALRHVVARNLAGEQTGVYSVCCSHPLVIEAAVDQALADGTFLLIEATANQVNQFGGYTGMTPSNFAAHVFAIAAARGMARDRIILGGDHLGPVCWTGEPAEAALTKAEALVAAFAAAGFQKLHLDCSMPCADDPAQLGDEVVAARAVRLCAAAERSARHTFGTAGIVYVIGTEVPPPGGADERLSSVEVTPLPRARRTLDIHRDQFGRAGLSEAWQRVIAMVVQPGVEFDHSTVVDYRPEPAKDLKAFAERDSDGVAFEAHSTDYQRPHAFAQLVRDHFAILKVGPALTFALREALFALDRIESEMLPPDRRARLAEICEERMRAEPKYWQRFYEGDVQELALLRHFSLSDRIRYYWPDPAICAASEALLENLSGRDIPLGLLGQYMPLELAQVRGGTLAPDPTALVKAHIRAALAPYAAACSPEHG